MMFKNRKLGSFAQFRLQELLREAAFLPFSIPEGPYAIIAENCSQGSCHPTGSHRPILSPRDGHECSAELWAENHGHQAWQAISQSDNASPTSGDLSSLLPSIFESEQVFQLVEAGFDPPSRSIVFDDLKW